MALTIAETPSGALGRGGLPPLMRQAVGGETAKKLRAKRGGTGYYEVPTPHGTYRVENTPSPKGSRYGVEPSQGRLPGRDDVRPCDGGL